MSLTSNMKRLLTFIGIVLAWIVVLWGCFVVVFGLADLYIVEFGGATPGDPSMGGDPAPTIGQSIGEIAIGVVMIAVALFGRHKMGKKRKAESAG